MKANLCWGRFTCFGLSLAIGMGLAVSAKAQTVLVDFGTNLSFRGATVTESRSKWPFLEQLFSRRIFSLISRTSTTLQPRLILVPMARASEPTVTTGLRATQFPPTSSHIAATDIDTVALGNLGVKEAAFDFAASPGPDGPVILPLT